jgi:hypothetical protein
MDMYGDQLHSIAIFLRDAGFTPSVRGASEARFVFADHAGRAIEVYWNGDGWLLEVFEEPEKAPVQNHQRDTPELAAKQAIDWLSAR